METLKVAAVQMNMVQCWSEKQFYHLIDNLTKKAVQNEAKIVVFPEDLGFCLAWAKESYRVNQIRNGNEINVQPLAVKNFLEKFSDWLFSKIKLNKMGEWVSQFRIASIIRRVFSKVALQNNVIIVSGSVYERRFDGIYNICYVYDSDGSKCGEYAKYKLVPLEKSWGVKSGKSSDPIKTSLCDIGVCICYDLDDPIFIKNMCDKGAQFLVAPSGGWRPYPDYPFDKIAESPQLQRSVENNISIVRPYCCGWLFPALYFQGHTQIVGPDGSVLAESQDWGKEKIFCLDLPIKARKII